MAKKEYIEREAALNALSRGSGCGNICSQSINRIPTSDVAPRSEVVREIFADINAIKKEYASGNIDGNELYIRLYQLEQKHTSPVLCKDCQHLMFSDCYGECSKGHRGIVKPDDTCKHGIRKTEGAKCN